jgi:hypothetical protein
LRVIYGQTSNLRLDAKPCLEFGDSPANFIALRLCRRDHARLPRINLQFAKLALDIRKLSRQLVKFAYVPQENLSALTHDTPRARPLLILNAKMQ